MILCIDSESLTLETVWLSGSVSLVASRNAAIVRSSRKSELMWRSMSLMTESARAEVVSSTEFDWMAFRLFPIRTADRAMNMRMQMVMTVNIWRFLLIFSSVIGPGIKLRGNSALFL